MTKNYISLLVIVLLVIFPSLAQSTAAVSLASTIDKDMTLAKNTTYIIEDQLHVSKGAVLTIEEGVTLKSKKAPKIVIVIDNGSRVHAAGSADNPIKAATEIATEENSIIEMRSSLSFNNATIANDFKYNAIEHPTILVNETPFIDTKISSVDTDF